MSDAESLDGMSTVEVRTSATAALIPTIRAVASDLAARADFDLDAISDLRMAVARVAVAVGHEQAPLDELVEHTRRDPGQLRASCRPARGLSAVFGQRDESFEQGAGGCLLAFVASRVDALRLAADRAA